jgi:hypothetical protein
MPSYNVSLGKVARTLLYEDSLGTMLFSFDVDTTGDRKFVILERPLNRLNEIDTVKDDRKRTAQHERVRLAFDRTRQHLIQEGHQVKIWPDEFEKSPEQKKETVKMRRNGHAKA